MLSTGLCYVARTFYALGRFEEAETALVRLAGAGHGFDRADWSAAGGEVVAHTGG